MLKKFNFKSAVIIVLILFIFFALFYLNQREVTFLKIIDYRTANIVWQDKVNEENSFIIKYLHSVARTEVLEIFVVRDGEIVLVSTEYQSYGAGLPFSNEHQYLIEDDKFIIKNINQKLDNIMLRVSAYAEHQFIYQDKNYQLYELVPAETLLEFRTEKLSYFKFLTWEVKKWLNLKN